MAKRTKKQIRERLEAIEAKHRPPTTAGFEQVVEQSRAWWAALVADGHEAQVRRWKTFDEFLREHGAPVVFGPAPIARARVETLERKLDVNVPASLRDLWTRHGGAAFMRQNDEEAAFVFSPSEVVAAAKRLAPTCDPLRKRYAAAFAARGANAEEVLANDALWRHGSVGWLEPAVLARCRLVPICPYYDGAFFLAAGLETARREAPVLCNSLDPDPETFAPYGDIRSWVALMAGWTMTEVTTWLVG